MKIFNIKFISKNIGHNGFYCIQISQGLSFFKVLLKLFVNITSNQLVRHYNKSSKYIKTNK